MGENRKVGVEKVWVFPSRFQVGSISSTTSALRNLWILQLVLHVFNIHCMGVSSLFPFPTPFNDEHDWFVHDVSLVFIISVEPSKDESTFEISICWLYTDNLNVFSLNPSNCMLDGLCTLTRLHFGIVFLQVIIPVIIKCFPVCFSWGRIKIN